MQLELSKSISPPILFPRIPDYNRSNPRFANYIVWDLGYLHIWDSYILIWCCPRYLDLVVIIVSHLLNERIGGILSLSAKSALYLLPDRDFSNASSASCLSLKEVAFPAKVIRSICCRRTIKTHLSRA